MRRCTAVPNSKFREACVRCSLLRPDLAQRTRLADVRDNLIARIAEAEREGRLGEVEGLRVSLAGAEEKIAQLDARQQRRSSKVFLGVPSFDQIGARTAVSPDHESTPGA
ncbi:hypothetical protein DY245_29990 [Streptomyces inhibens]|uniref:Uncharacterized protein n=1 Tax=Streptomyces inhibens TaxID=2293571 RepID=A0A371PWN3_STRIH|nr:hypothetical protein DY245_29990 [Streptomyces inhibens]